MSLSKKIFDILFYRHNGLHEVVPFYSAKVDQNINPLDYNGS